MNLLGLLLGATAVKQLTDYPAEIRNLRKQLPKEERGSFIREYKQLSGEAKAQFKDLLRNADLKAAGSLVGRDLTPYKAAGNAKSERVGAQLQEELGADIIDRVNRILAVPTDIDPALVAEAARKYEEAALSTGADIIDRVNRILAVPTDIDPALVAEAARKYDEAALPAGADIIERTNRILDLSR